MIAWRHHHSITPPSSSDIKQLHHLNTLLLLYGGWWQHPSFRAERSSRNSLLVMIIEDMSIQQSNIHRHPLQSLASAHCEFFCLRWKRRFMPTDLTFKIRLTRSYQDFKKWGVLRILTNIIWHSLLRAWGVNILQSSRGCFFQRWYLIYRCPFLQRYIAKLLNSLTLLSNEFLIYR